MTWLVFGVSCLLVLAGAVSIISGAPIIQLERGWAEVISGTVALSSGGVVFALAVVLVRLETLRDAVARRAEVVPVPAETTAPEVPTPPPAGEEPAPAPPAAVPELPPAAAEAPAAEHALWKRIRRPNEVPEAGRLEAEGFPDRVVPETPAPLEPAAPPVIVPPHRPAEVAAGTTGDFGLAAEETGQIGWLDRSLGKGRSSRSRPADPAPAEPMAPTLFGARPTEDAGRRDPLLGAAPAFAGSDTTAAGASSGPALEPGPTPDLAAEHHDGVSVIGRYQAGTSSYVMYSDGTIEVETEGGQIHRFGSMDELKGYIASQDGPTA